MEVAAVVEVAVLALAVVVLATETAEAMRAPQLRRQVRAVLRPLLVTEERQLPQLRPLQRLMG